MFSNWMKLGWDWTMLAIESQQVLALRVAKLSLGGATASKEASRMVSEKVIAAGQVAAHTANGGSAHSVVKKYRKKVRSNRRRLAKSRVVRKPSAGPAAGRAPKSTRSRTR